MQKKKKSEILKRKDFLNLLANSKSSKRRKALIALADSDELKSLVEIFLNALYGNLPIPKSLVKKMRRGKKFIYELVGRKTSAKRRKQLLSKGQVGGILPHLLALGLPAVFGALMGR